MTTTHPTKQRISKTEDPTQSDDIQPRATVPSGATGQKLAGARLWAAQRFPYLATGLFALTLLEQPGLGAVAADDRWRLYADPDVVAGLTVPQLGTALVHHLGHLLRDHARRAEDAGAGHLWGEAWNLAADLEINDDLVADGGKFAETPPLPEHFGWDDGWLAETYLTHILQGQDSTSTGDSSNQAATSGTAEVSGGGSGGGSGGELGSEEDASSGTSANPSDDPNGPDGEGPQANNGQPDASGREPCDADGSSGGHHRHTGCGSAADGRHRPWELEASNGDPGIDIAAGDLIRRTVARDVLVHAKEVGTVPGDLLRWAEAEPSVIDWRQVLAAEIRRGLRRASGSVDFTFARRSRRSAALDGVVLPGLFRPAPEVAIVIDTSGSMSPNDLAEALGEVDAILDRAGLASRRVPVLACDAEVGAITLATRASDVVLAGGGGTDMGAGLEAAARLHPRPQVVVVLTDGYTPWPTEAPGGTSVIIGLLREETEWAGERPVPRWARAVEIGRAA